jgi:phospholipid/cholesterol/gamma-HCH transport system permease protein
MIDHTNMEDLIIGMIKGFVFGMIITLISCHQGLAAENGAVGVGTGTTNAVVISSLVLLIVNFFLSILLNYIFPIGSV